MADEIEALEALHQPGGDDCHFRFSGSAHGHSFLVNVQFSALNEGTGDKLPPVQFDFLICKILLMILTHIAKHPNSDLH